MTIASIRGVNIHYEVVGIDGPWLVLVSGGRRAYREFIPLAMKIAAEGFRVLLHDRRNTGASQIVIDGDQGEEEIWTDDIAALIDHLGIGPVFVGGASSGARTSMLTYLRHPASVRALILMRVTGGEFAAGRLPDMYYGDLIRAAREGGMAAVSATEQYKERIAAYPPNGPYLMGHRMCSQPSRDAGAAAKGGGRALGGLNAAPPSPAIMRGCDRLGQAEPGERRVSSRRRCAVRVSTP